LSGLGAARLPDFLRGPAARDFLLIGAAAALVRAVYLAQLGGYDLADVLILDPRAYDAEAQRILAGQPLPVAFYQAPFYSYFLAALYTLFGRSFLAVRLVQMALGVATVLLTVRLASRLFGRSAGVVAGVMAILYGVLPYYEGQIMKTSMTVFLALLVLTLLEPLVGGRAGEGEVEGRRPVAPRYSLGGRRPSTSPSPALGGADEEPEPASRWAGFGRAFLAGGVLGLAVLTRENLILFAPAGAALLYMRTRRAAPAALFVLGAALAILPVTLHNYRAEGEWILVTSQGGQNFYIGNHAQATGTYANPMFVRPDPLYERSDFHMEAERRTGGPLTSGEASSFWYAEALKEMIAQPARVLALLARKLVIVFEGVERPDNESLYTMRDETPVLDALSLSIATIAPLGFLGMILARQRAGELLFLHLFVLVNVLALVLFFVVSRYRVALAPVLIIFAAHSLVRMASWARARRARALAAAALVLAVPTAVLSEPEWAGPDPRDYHSTNFYLNRARIYAAGERLGEAAASYESAIALADTLAFLRFEYADVLRKLERGDEARRELAKAVQIRPEFPTARNNLGILLAEGGDWPAAEREFREAARLAPGWSDPLQNLARLYDMTGNAQARDAALFEAQRIERRSGR
jgi:4-amino-4-deoxy-L-arabinose transferase-like glycosyltransferase